jgi:hypothetical protein
MDRAKRSWHGQWEGDAAAVLEAAESAVAASEPPIAVTTITLDWETQTSRPATVQAAREKLLLMVEPPESVELVLGPPIGDEPPSALHADYEKLILLINGGRGSGPFSGVRVSGSGTDVVSFVQAFDAAVAALSPDAVEPATVAASAPDAVEPAAVAASAPDAVEPAAVAASAPDAVEPAAVTAPREKPWFKNPVWVIPLLVALITAAAAIAAALIQAS